MTIVACFLFTPWPREVVALTGAGVLLMSRRLHSRQMLGLVDWELLVLFIGLFVVNHALQKTGLPARLVAIWRRRRATAATRPAIRDDLRAVEHRLQRTGGDAAASQRRAHAGRVPHLRW